MLNFDEMNSADIKSILNLNLIQTFGHRLVNIYFAT